MSGHVTIRQRIRYRFDNIMAKGMWAVLLWLMAITALFMIAVAVVIHFLNIGPDDQGIDFSEGLWLAITRSLDPGTFADSTGGNFRITMLVVTLAGIFIAATIIGLISSAIDARVESLRRGRSLVVESGHTLIVGASDKLPTIVGELVEANASEKGRAIVVLTEDDPVEVGDEIRATVSDLKGSRLVVRTGQPTRMHDLATGNPQAARSVIVLRSPDGSDAQVVKIVLALSRLVPGLDGLTVVAELEDAHTAEAIKDALGPNLITVTPMDIIARISAQVSRASGLGSIYQELLDFDGDEMYTIPVGPAWAGRTFGQLVLASSRATILGVRHADGTVELSPHPQSVLAADDFAIGIAEDDSTFVLDREPSEWQPLDEREFAPLPKATERTLIVGWSALAPLVAQEIETHVAAGSQLHVLLDPGTHDLSQVGQSIELRQQELVLHEGDPIDRSAISRVMDEGPFDHIMLLAEQAYDPDEADARTLLTLLHVRSVAEETVIEENVVAELLDPHDVELGGGSTASDFIVSQKLISLLMAQLSESPHLAPVFADLFDSDGAVVALHPASRYVEPGEMAFEDIVRAARDWGTVAIGYRSASAAGVPGALPGGIRVNPAKSERVVIEPGDTIVVISRT